MLTIQLTQYKTAHGKEINLPLRPDWRHLYIDKCAPYAEQESEELGDEIVARLNPDSGEIENLEILFFSKRLVNGTLMELPIVADFRLAS